MNGLAVCKHTVKADGVSGLFRGFGTLVVGTIAGRGLFLTSLEVQTVLLRDYNLRLLKALGSTTYATTRHVGSEESTLPSSLSLIFCHSHKFGGDIFSSAVTLMSELIHKDPTCFSMLPAACLTTSFLDAISEDWVANGKSYPNDQILQWTEPQQESENSNRSLKS